MTAQDYNETDLIGAALRLGRSYRATLDALLRGELTGHRDARGRWRVDVASVEALAQREAARVPTAA